MGTGNKLLWFRRHPFLGLVLAIALIAAGLADASLAVAGGNSGSGSSGKGGGTASTLSPPPRTGGSIVNNDAAIRLGKALFWDEQSGGDGRIACATCHFHAGADNRVVNTLHPGPDGIFDSGGVRGPGQRFTPANIVNDDRVGSQGIASSKFVEIRPGNAVDNCMAVDDPIFHDNRRTTGRNTPPMINAVFNRQNFWDGRANDNFNGNDPFGNTANQLGHIGKTVTNSSLASQAVGPPNNPVEMSCDGRVFNGPGSLGAKMLSLTPLGRQQVSRQDSALGGLSNWPGNGLTKSYSELITDAYGATWGTTAAVQAANFSRIWGEAVQAYVSTLISDQAPFDRYMEGDRSALTSNQQRGLDRFNGKGQCAKCHAGRELTDASISFYNENGPINEDGGDQGFHNTGVRPAKEDAGRAGLGPNGASFSESGSEVDNGAFKTPSLHNVGLRAPHFHNGGKKDLEAVVDFYDRGGDFPHASKRVKPMGFSSEDKAALVDFLQNGLTDCRVAREEAPFDHPSIDPPNGVFIPATGGSHTCK